LILKYIELPQSPQILEVGCGNGYFTYYLKDFGRTIGVDYARTMLSLNPCSDLIQASAFQLPFADNEFDLSFCSNLLHHMTEPVAAIKEMKRVSKRYVAISEPNRNNPAILTLGLLKSEERESLRFSGAFLRSLAEQAGLRVLACETMGFVTPNRMPRPIVKLVSRFNGPNPFGAYAVLVAQGNE
jgi:ubiquinone/menaquinone biosynthesis C-methylase UbiE